MPEEVNVGANMAHKAQAHLSANRLGYSHLHTCPGVVEFAANLKSMDSNPVNKDAMAKTMSRQKKLFDRSLALVKDLPSGHILLENDLTLKKPGGGLTWSDRSKIINRPLSRDMSMNRILKIEDVS